MKIKKSELNKNIRLSEGNMTSECTDDTLFLTWSLPSRATCPYATELCKKKCFAKKNESFKTVRESRGKNLAETYKDTFIEDMIKYFEYHLQRPKAQDKLIVVRIHTSGDFYNVEYLKKWVDIADHFKNNKNILFQAHTKSMPVLMDYMKWYENKYSIRYEEGDYKIFIETINIRFVWSIWGDTNEDYTELAHLMDLQTFKVFPKDEIEDDIKEGAFLCSNYCGLCMECYTGRNKQIVAQCH